MRELKVLRSLLFVPADNESKLVKARQIPADALVLDWEDSVAPESRPSARKRTAEVLKERQQFPQVILIRVSGVGTQSFQADCDVLANELPDGLMLSKCCSAEDVLRLAEFLKDRDPQGRCGIYPLIESPAGLLNAFAITTSSDRVAGLAFGAEDFSAETGLYRTADEIELLYARSMLVTAGRAAGREVYDSPCIEFQDLEKLRGSARRARNLGFTGKMAIHPSQVAVLNATFSPTEAEVERARSLLEGFSSQNAGVVVLEGQMVDEAVLRQARRVLSIAAGSPDPQKANKSSAIVDG
ncbi:MAG: HpcH/HpaI aldolase/citrate lyase family protein [Terriglobia bacterium]